MENFELLDKDILTVSEGRIVKGKKTPLFGIVLFLVGLLITGVSSMGVIAVDGLQIFVFSVGLVLLVYGIVKMFVRGDSFVDSVSNLQLEKEELYFDISEFEKLKSFYNDKKFSKISDLKISPQGGGVLLTIYGTKNGTLYYSQLSKYVPYQYVPVTKTIEHESNENIEILNLINHYKK